MASCDVMTLQKWIFLALQYLIFFCRQICQSKKLRLEEKGGEACISYDFVIPILEVQRAFYANALKECIVLRLLQEMYRLGYDLIISAKMTSGKDVCKKHEKIRYITVHG